MLATTFIDNAKVMSKGQVTIPKDVRDGLGVSNGDRVTFVVENGSVHIFNSAIYTMKMFQAQMAGEAANAGITSEEDIQALVDEVLTAISVVSTQEEEHESETVIRDVLDRPILRAAINTNADILPTGDKDFLESGLTHSRIMIATEFL